MADTKTPKEIIQTTIQAGETKTKLPLPKMILLGILAGMFIAGGAAASNVIMHDMNNVGIARLLGGACFPVGLMMIVLTGCELFTGDNLMIMGLLDRRYKLTAMLKVLIVVYISNLIGSAIAALFVYLSGQFSYTDQLLGAYTIKVAYGKISLSFGKAMFSGILCNIFVCLAVFMATASGQVAGKILGIFFPIMAFVVSGYEHCVANMYYIPAGILAAGNSAFAAKAQEVYGYTAAELGRLNVGNYFVKNLLPVTLGNLIGGMLFVGVVYYVVYGRERNRD